MARSLDQILSELNPSYSGSESIINTRLNAIPGETEAGVAQADAKLAQANTNILDASRRRGLGFSGIPVGEQAQYAATDYAPAIANLKSSGAQKELTLQESLQQLARDKRSQAQSIYEGETARDLQERQFAEQTRQFNENLAAQERQAAAARAAATSPVADISRYLGGQAQAGQGGSQPSVSRNKAGGFAFTGSNGAPITAAQYAAQTKQSIGNILYEMGSQGDKSAQYAYNQLKARPNDPTTLNVLRTQFPQLLGAV
ncbi:hypothetical protein C5C39_06845 [Rathayibacter sp. AY1F3]|uniref:hypothetical protein n=1 Tax=unclassified Rathayibacter TaxID=2609250 RepID=UPI000CE8BDA3|nr:MULTISPECIES: hypothetical protein [unclassified Rathayibacter]PPG91544.1 hypothetical protein C5C39_06845 [Rathayibacter sp. AY1F3]PPH13314.1 hypothetical protein C5C71_01835 [Rathayibacter sp. AY1C1]